MRAGFLIFKSMFHVAWGISFLALIGLPKPGDSWKGRVVSRWLGTISKVYGIRAKVVGTLHDGPCLIVANHVTWLDITTLGSLKYVSFLSKAEVSRWPLIGFLATRSGTLYIHRGKKGATEATLKEMTEALKAGRSVVLFPEGTTTNGIGVRKFHARLFQAAIDANVPVQPIALQYLQENGEYDDLVPYVGDQSMLENVQAIAQRKTIIAQYTAFDILDSQAYSRDELGRMAFEPIFYQVTGDLALDVKPDDEM